MVVSDNFVIAKIFNGEIQEDDLKVVPEELPPLELGDYLVEALYLSVDPYMRFYSGKYRLGQVMVGLQVAKVVESRSYEHPKGTLVIGFMGWRTFTIILNNDDYQIRVLPDLGHLSPSLALGVLGRPGNSAYFGFLDICKPKEGETVVVSGAAGAVGSHVGQIALIKGCTVIGIAGTDLKCRWLKTLGFHHVINYKTTRDLAKELREVAPNGIDCYFDNVGGEMSSTVIYQMNEFGRVSVCGSISAYNDISLPKVTLLQTVIWSKQLELRGFIVTQFMDRWADGIQQNLEWVREGKLKYRETFTDGFENSVKALSGLFKGENFGKAIVRVKTSYVDTQVVDFRNALDTFKQLEN